MGEIIFHNKYNRENNPIYPPITPWGYVRDFFYENWNLKKSGGGGIDGSGVIRERLR